MTRKYIGIEEARGKLGDLVTAAQQGAEIILTRNRKPVAQITRYQEDTVSTYTVQVEASNADRSIWQALAPAENVTALNGETARDIAEMVASNQNIADGDNWRVRVWDGADADTSSTPDVEHYADGSFAVPLSRIPTTGGRPTIHQSDLALLARIARETAIHEQIRTVFATSRNEGDDVAEIIDRTFPELMLPEAPLWDTGVVVGHLEWLVKRGLPLDQAPYDVQPA